MKKLLRINLDDERFEFSEMPDKYRNLGGRGLVSRIIAQEVPPACDPLGKENLLIISPGILAGTRVPNSGRISIGAKSPLTNGIKESNAGGDAARKLARLGIQAIVLEGGAAQLTTLKIEKDDVSFIVSKNLAMTGNLACIDFFRKTYGDTVSVISIGQAGEMKLKAAGVSVTSPDFHPRMAARGGLGAVMGAKNVKAIVIDDAEGANVDIKNKDLFNRSVKAFTKGITAHPLADGLRHFGTPLLVGMINEMGAISTKNYAQGRFDGAEKISGEAIAERMHSRPGAQNTHRCMPGCVISCSNVITDEAGSIMVSGLEYETIALMGSNCLIDDIDVIARMNGVCNDVGVDTMDVGGAIAVAMESGLLEWGDGAAALSMVREIKTGTQAGTMIGNGCKHTGETLGVKRIPHVKGQCLSGYDPPGAQGHRRDLCHLHHGRRSYLRQRLA